MSPIQPKQIDFLSPSSTQIVYVSKGGSDAAGNGSEERPFLTIQAAMSSITDSSTTKRYIVLVGPGDWNDPFVLKVWTSVVGLDSALSTRINTASVTLDSAFGTPTNQRSAFVDIRFNQPLSLTFPAGSQGKVYFEDCAFNKDVTISNLSTSPNVQSQLINCYLYANFTVSGLTFMVSESSFEGANAFSVSGGAAPTAVTIYGSGSDGTMSVVWAAGQQPVSVECFGANFAALSLDGASITYTGNADSIPAGVTRLNGAPAPVLTTSAAAVAYAPAVPGNWLTPPTEVAEALDEIAAMSVPIYAQAGTSAVVSTAAPSVVPWTAVNADTFGVLDGATGVFTCPANGLYQVQANIEFNGVAAPVGTAFSVAVAKNGTAYVKGNAYQPTATPVPLTASAVAGVPCVAGDRLTIVVSSGVPTTTTGVSDDNFLTIFRSVGP